MDNTLLRSRKSSSNCWRISGVTLVRKISERRGLRMVVASVGLKKKAPGRHSAGGVNATPREEEGSGCGGGDHATPFP